MKRKKYHDDGSEMIVVGSAMRCKENFEALAQIIKKAEYFYQFKHQALWRAFYRMHREGLEFNEEVTANTLHAEKTFADIGAAYLIDLWEVGHTLAPADIAEHVAGLYFRRRTMDCLGKIEGMASDKTCRPEEFVAQAYELVEVLAAEVRPDDGSDEDAARDAGYVMFPTEHLPGFLGEYALAGADALHCDPAFIAVPSLVTMGAAIGTSRVIEVKESWCEPSIFWAATVADPSQMKSPSYDLAVAPLWDMQHHMSSQFDCEWKRYRDELEEYNTKKYSKFKKGGSDDDGVKPVKPVNKKIVVSDITVEKLAQVLYENPHGVCLCREELSGWFKSFGQYSGKGGGGADMSLWLQLFGARRLQVDRKTGDMPSIYIPRASCSVSGTVQPKLLQRLLVEEFFESGLVSRLLLFMPPRREKVWTENIVPESVYRPYSDAVKDIYRTGQDILEYGGNEPRRITFTPSGKEAWIDFYGKWAKRQKEAEGEYGYALAKLEGYCARFCLLLSIADKQYSPSNRDVVKASHVEDAFGLTEWFAYETQRVYTRLRTPADQQARDRLVELIAGREGWITPRDLRKTNPKRYLSIDDAVKALDGLAEHGLGQWEHRNGGDAGGRPTRAFRLALPKTHATQN